MTIEAFMNRFVYDHSKAGYIGVERETFTADASGKIVPQAARVLGGLKGGFVVKCRESVLAREMRGEFGEKPQEPSYVLRLGGSEFGYELSACQVESRVGPCTLDDLKYCLSERDAQLRLALGHYGLAAQHTEVGPEDMPLDVYPDPTGRYQRITKDMPRETLLAACRIIGTHVHVGMPDHETALRVYNRVIRHTKTLCAMGDNSNGRRMAIYTKMAPESEPTPYADWGEYYETACARGFAEDPRKCWTLIRMSVHGTIEFRMFGAVDSIDRIADWAQHCHRLCLED